MTQDLQNRHPAPADPTAVPWRESDTLFLLTCYDVWSATPSRGCDAAAPAVASS